MDVQATLTLPINDISQAGEARRIAIGMAQSIGMDASTAGRVAIVVTELARNISLHAGRGQILLQPMTEGQRQGIKIFALDKGPGMDVDRCLRDGYSTAGTPGTGMGAIVRMSDEFDIYSGAGVGTAILSVLWSGSQRPKNPAESRVVAGAVNVPVRGERESGDGWDMSGNSSRTQILVVDGLGHGPMAADAARMMIAAFRADAGRAPVFILERAHAAMRASRGAAVAIADIDIHARQVRYVGVGNISGTIVVPGSRNTNMVSHNGTIGMEARRIHEFAYAWPTGALLVMHSDGIATHWSLDSYPGLTRRNPGLIAAVIYRDFKRERDDVTVVVAKEKRTE